VLAWTAGAGRRTRVVHARLSGDGRVVRPRNLVDDRAAGRSCSVGDLEPGGGGGVLALVRCSAPPTARRPERAVTYRLLRLSARAARTTGRR